VSETIQFHAHLLERGRRLFELARPSEARAILQPLLDDSRAEPDIRAEAHRVLGELDLDAGNFRGARRHFATAIGLQPSRGGTYLRYAAAVHADSAADPRKAYTACRRAIRLSPCDANCWLAYGASCLRIGDHKRARRAFRRAARLQPDDLKTLAAAVGGLTSLGRHGEARRVLEAARFRAPRNAGILGLWNRFRFDSARRKQVRQHSPLNDDAALLPFVPARDSSGTEAAASPVVLRADRSSRATPHLLRLFGRQSDPRRAN
jgi:Flp pilus assembly protein TadD